MDGRRRRLIADGFAAGMIGYVLVAAFFGLVDAYAGRSLFHTAAFIGSPLSPGSIVVASLVAVVGIAVYLVLSHRGAVRTIRAAQQARLGRVE